ncbi:MAG TPA: hypothetical protein PKJ51_05375 [Methanothrix sp.]|nr:hypothetical protein [Methanothrix sp.]
MNKIMLSMVLIISLMGVAAAHAVESGVEMRPGEAAAEWRFEQGFGSPWVGGDPPSRSSFGPSHPQLYSIHRPGFPFVGPHYWSGVHIRPIRICHPFSDCYCKYYCSSDFVTGLKFK